MNPPRSLISRRSSVPDDDSSDAPRSDLNPHFGASRVVRKRTKAAGIGLLVLLLTGTIILSLFIGAREIPPPAVFEAIQNIPAGLRSLENADSTLQIVIEVRVPRTFLAVVVGLALGTAGALIQGHTRNPLADPGILGVAAGSALAVVLAFTWFGLSSSIGASVCAFAGALIATFAVFGISAAGGGQLQPLTLILGGAALSAVLTSLTSAIVLAESRNLERMRFWAVGSVAGRDLSFALHMLPILVITLPVAFATASQLNLLNLGEEVAASLGIDTRKSRIYGIVLISLLTGAATAAAGPIGFLGLVVPHLARFFTGPDYRWILPYSALIGALLLLTADIVGRIVARPGELQVGIVLAFIGAPFFILLVRKRRLATI